MSDSINERLIARANELALSRYQCNIDPIEDRVFPEHLESFYKRLVEENLEELAAWLSYIASFPTSPPNQNCLSCGLREDWPDPNDFATLNNPE